MSDFGRMVEAEIPRLRRYARALTRDALTRDISRADDLVQSCLTRAIAKQHLWPNLRAWLFTILHNQHVSDVRRAAREVVTVSVEDAPTLTTQPNAYDVLRLRDLRAEMDRLPIEQREAILLIGLEGLPYEDAAKVLNVPIGTIRSRLSRGRDQLRKLMGMDDEPAAAA